VIEVLAKLVSVHGAPTYLRSDNGPEFITSDPEVAHHREHRHRSHRSGQAVAERLNESFNGKFRDECLSMQWFENRIDAKILIEDFRRGYNEVRPHSSLGQLTPAELKLKLSQQHPTMAIPK
jgi:putative transposase